MSNSADSKTEERTAAISYVITFYKDLQSLFHFYALLVNATSELSSEISKNKLADEQKQQLATLIQNVRYHATKCKLFVSAMGEEAKIDKKTKETIEEAYKKTTDNFIPNFKSLETFVSELNRFFVKNVAKHILKNNVELISEIYGGGQT